MHFLVFKIEHCIQHQHQHQYQHFLNQHDTQLEMKINNAGVENSLELSKHNQLRCYIPSSIVAFGPTTPHENVPDLTILCPTTIYVIAKVYLELLGEYHKQYDVDFHSLRYPRIIRFAVEV